MKLIVFSLDYHPLRNSKNLKNKQFFMMNIMWISSINVAKMWVIPFPLPIKNVKRLAYRQVKLFLQGHILCGNRKAEEITDVNKSRSCCSRTIMEQNRLYNEVRRFKSQYPLIHRLVPPSLEVSASASCKWCVGGTLLQPVDAFWQAQWRSLHGVDGKTQSVNIHNTKVYLNPFRIYVEKISKVQST